MNKLIVATLLSVTMASTLSTAEARNTSGHMTWQEIAEKTCQKQPKGPKRNACWAVEYNQLEYHYADIGDALESDRKASDAFNKATRQKDYVNILKYYKQGFNVYKRSGNTYELPNPQNF